MCYQVLTEGHLRATAEGRVEVDRGWMGDKDAQLGRGPGRRARPMAVSSAVRPGRDQMRSCAAGKLIAKAQGCHSSQGIHFTQLHFCSQHSSLSASTNIMPVPAQPSPASSTEDFNSGGIQVSRPLAGPVEANLDAPAHANRCLRARRRTPSR